MIRNPWRLLWVAMLTGCVGPLAQLSDPNLNIPSKNVLDGAAVLVVTDQAITQLSDRAPQLLGSFLETNDAGWVCIVLEEWMAESAISVSSAVGPFKTDIEVRDVEFCLDPSALEMTLVTGASKPTLRLTASSMPISLRKPMVLAGGVDWIGFEANAACLLDNDAVSSTGAEYALKLSVQVDAELSIDATGAIDLSTTTHQFDVNELSLSIAKDCQLVECTDENPGGIGDPCLECDVCEAVDFGASLWDLANEVVSDAIGPISAALIDGITKPLMDKWLRSQSSTISGRIALGNLLGSVTESAQTTHPLSIVSRPAPNGLSTLTNGTVSVLQLRTEGGTHVPVSHSCVPSSIDQPVFNSGPFPAMFGNSAISGSYDVGFALSEAFINQLFYSLYRSGALCLGLTTRELAALTGGKLQLRSGPLDALIPGVAALAGRDASVRLGLKPSLPVEHWPIIRLNDEPLGGITIQWPGFQFTVDAFVDNDYMRMMAVAADLSVEFDVAVAGPNLSFSIKNVAIENVKVTDNHAFETVDLEAVIALGVDVALSALSGPEGIVIPIVPAETTTGILDGLPLTLAGLETTEGSHPWLAVTMKIQTEPGSKPGQGVAGWDIKASPRWVGGQIEVDLTADVDRMEVRVDGLSWHRATLTHPRKLSISHPLLRIPGPHVVEMRAHGIRREHVVSTPTQRQSLVFADSTSVSRTDRSGCATHRAASGDWMVIFLLVGFVFWRTVGLRRWIVLMALAVGACTPPVDGRLVCQEHVDCPSGTTCDPGTGFCAVPPPCSVDDDCCPGLMCVDDLCRYLVECKSNDDCTGQDQDCAQGVCVAALCDADIGCEAPYNQCRAGRCVVALPCGQCPMGEVCEPATGRCLNVSGECSSLSCPIGTAPWIVEQSLSWSLQCGTQSHSCACVVLPGLVEPMPGSWPTLVSVPSTTNSSLRLITRDNRFGDLVATSLESDQQWGAAQFLDGVPSGPVVGAPDGPRGGVVEPGPDVGRYATAVSTEGGYAALSRDATNGVLRFVGVEEDQVVSAYDLDDGSGGTLDCGFGASLARAPDGGLHALSFAVSASGIHVIRYSKTLPGDDTPTGPTAWETNSLTFSLGNVKPTEPCKTECGLLEACVAVDGASTCKMPDVTATCDPLCDVGHVCVDSVCRAVVRPSAQIQPWLHEPFGETAAVFSGASLVVAYEDVHRGALSLIHTNPSQWVNATPQIIDGGGGVRVGRHLAMDGADDGRVALVYQDSTHERLRVVWGSLNSGWIPWDVEAGGVGADVVILPDGSLAIAHGLPDGQTVRLLTGVPGSWNAYEPPWAPHVGRFNSLLFSDNALVWVGIGHHLTDAWELMTVLNVDWFPLDPSQ